ncbi:MAG: hypothetical protein IJX59_06640 [Clostridia bacterium]|nr:hypothetical protein [Clostridia bacterium]MBQ9130424.1 hypothetical protein [Clostridia bacterium]
MKIKKTLLILLAVLLGLSLPLALYGVYAATTSTPLVLVSEDYITNYLLPLLNKENSSQDTEIEALNNKYNTLLAQYEALNENYNKLIEGGAASGSSVSAGFTSIKLEMGTKLLPYGDNQVCLEVIVSRGSAQILSPLETQGILDVSTGSELFNGVEAPLNHYLLVPHANDGRAIAAVSGDVWVLVRGGYTVENIE